MTMSLNGPVNNFNHASGAVVVTGIGLVTPLGLDRETTWKNLLAGQTAIFSTDSGLEARVGEFSPNGSHSRAGAFAVQAASEAARNAGLSPDELATLEAGCAIGQSKPLLVGMADSFNPALVLASYTGWSLEAVVRNHLDLQGPTANVAAACATGVASIETAAAWIRSGRCDVAFAGASESSLSDFYRAGFRQMGVLAEGTDPRTVRPFDRARSGFAMGEGAAVMVLESEMHARRRGAKIICTLSSIRLRHSVLDAVRFDEDGTLVAKLIHETCADRRPSYVNLHGTGTVVNDAAEALGVRRAFGDGATGIVGGSTKASTGHLLGAAGAVEAAFCALAVRDGVAPPSIHIENPDPAVDFQLAGRGERAPVTSALSLSYGFGGQMAAVLFGKS